MDIWRLRCPYGQGYGRWGLSEWWSQYISGNLCKSTLGQKDESHNNLIGSQGRAVVITFFSFPDQSTKCIASKNIISFTKGDLFTCIGSEVLEICLQVSYFEDGCWTPAPESVLRGLTMVDWSKFGLTMKECRTVESGALAIQFEQPSRFSFFFFVLHIYHNSNIHHIQFGKLQLFPSAVGRDRI